MSVYHQSGEVGSSDTGSQSWNDSHQQINNGAMNGFATTGPGSMGYYTDEDLPFYYSVANTFCLANRWFCSVPAQTYPNRRFLMSGTANGIISTDIDNVTTNYPPNGTIWDRLSTYGISWTNYFSDAPTSIIMFDTVAKHPTNYASIAEFFVDVAAGTLPAVSLVDCDMGAITGEVGGLIAPYPGPHLRLDLHRSRQHRTVRGESRRHSAGRAIRRQRDPGGDGGTRLAPHPDDLALRRARWLLRPRRPADARRPPTRWRPSSPPATPRAGTTSTAPGFRR